jgi:hypothetical protein
MDIAVLTTVWQRHALERLILAYYATLRVPGHRLRLVVVGSEGLASIAIAPCDALYVESPNQPLGAKWNVGLLACQLLDVDAVMVTGSDDIINARAIEVLMEGLRGVDWVQPDGAWMWDMETDRHAWMRFDPGAGRIYSRKLLERIGWRLWDEEATVKLDGSALDTLIKARARRREVESLHRQGGVILDIKTGTNLWSYDMMAGLLEPPKPRETIDEILQKCGLSREYFRSAYIGLDLEPNRTPHGCIQ